MKRHVSEKHLSSYVDGDLNAHERKRIEEHLRECKACSLRLEEFQLIKTTAAKLEQVEVPEGMLVGIRARLADEVSQAPVTAGRRRQFGFWHGIAIGAALTSVVLMFVLFPHFGILGPQEPRHETLTLGFSAEEAGPPMGLVKAQDYAPRHEIQQTPATQDYAAYESNGGNGHIVFANQTQPVADTGIEDTSPRPYIIMEPLDEEARRRMLDEKGVIQVFPFEGPDLRFAKPRDDDDVRVVPVLEADTNTKLDKLYYYK